MKDGKDKRVLLADQEYKETLSAIQKEREDYLKKAKEAKVEADPAALAVFDQREVNAKDTRNNNVANIAEEYKKQLDTIQNDTEARFRTNLDNRLRELDDYYKEQIRKAKEAGEEEEGDFIQRLLRMKEAERDRVINGEKLTKNDFYEQLALAEHENQLNSTYFVEEGEKKKLEILIEYAEKRRDLLLSMGDEESRLEAILLQKQIDGYNKALAKPSKKTVKALVDEKAIKALQAHYKNLGASEDEALEKAIEFAEGFTDKMKTVSEVVDLLKMSFGGMSAELDMALDAVGSIARGFAEGGLVGGISSAVGQLMSITTTLITAKKEVSQSTIETYEAYMSAIHRLIDKQIALLSKLGDEAFGKNIEDTTSKIESALWQSRNMLERTMKAGAGMFSHSYGYEANKVLRRMSDLLEQQGIYKTELSEMTNAEIARLREIPQIYARLPKEIREYVDAIGESLDQLEEFKEQAQETVLGLDFTSIADMIVNALTDPSIENALDDLEKSIDETLASIVASGLKRKLLSDPLEKMVGDLYQTMEKKDENGNTIYELSAKEAQHFKEGVLDLGKQFEKAWSELEETFGKAGINLMPSTDDSSSDNTLKGAYAKASQESIELLAGQTGAQRVVIENIKDVMGSIYDLQVKGWGGMSLLSKT
ncbi:MAG: hypothetical protein LUD74_03610 [Tannerellaceae bacterium]|nr:hypothetical protein [Tannerellaceae bacterium]